MAHSEYLARLDGCVSDEELTTAVNAELARQRAEIGEAAWQALSEDWILDDLDSIDEIRDSAKELKSDAEARKKDPNLEALWSVLDACLRRAREIKDLAAAA